MKPLPPRPVKLLVAPYVYRRELAAQADIRAGRILLLRNTAAEISDTRIPTGKISLNTIGIRTIGFAYMRWNSAASAVARAIPAASAPLARASSTMDAAHAWAKLKSLIDEAISQPTTYRTLAMVLIPSPITKPRPNLMTPPSALSR